MRFCLLSAGQANPARFLPSAGHQRCFNLPTAGVVINGCVFFGTVRNRSLLTSSVLFCYCSAVVPWQDPTGVFTWCFFGTVKPFPTFCVCLDCRRRRLKQTMSVSASCAPMGFFSVKLKSIIWNFITFALRLLLYPYRLCLK